MLKAFAISSKRGEVLFHSIFDPTVTKDVFTPFLTELSSSPHGDPPPAFSRDGQDYVYVFRDDFYWVCVVGQDSLLAQCGPLLVVESVAQVHQACSVLCGALTQHSITANTTLIAEVVMETMSGGLLQPQPADKLQAHIYSSVVTAKESSALTASPGLFGIEKSAPSTAAQQSAFAVDTGKRELYVDVVERVWAAVAAGGTVVRAEVSGCILVRGFVPGRPTLTLTLNTHLSTAPQPGFSTTSRMSEVEYDSGVSVEEAERGRQLSVPLLAGQEVTVVRYTLSPDHPHLLPFTLSSSITALTASDAELKLKLSSNTGMGSVAPQVSLRLTAPPTTAAIMSRTSGPRGQTVTFTPDTKTITWTITQFPGGSYAQAFIRLVDCGAGATVEVGELEFEVSRWVCSGLRVEQVRLTPPCPSLSQWVRYLTTSDSVTIRLT